MQTSRKLLVVIYLKLIMINGLLWGGQNFNAHFMVFLVKSFCRLSSMHGFAYHEHIDSEIS